MSDVIILNKAEAYAKIKAAYDAGELSAQNPPSKESGCFYRHPETQCPCAVGVLIPDDNPMLKHEALNNEPIHSPDLRDFIQFAEGDRAWFETLQELHDSWQGHKLYPQGAERDFLAHLEKANPNA